MNMDKKSQVQTMIRSISVYREGDNPIFGESATHITLEDSGSGAWIELEQATDEPEPETIKIDFDEFDHISNAVKMLKKEAEKAGIYSD
jgi:hypothetical protein